MVLEGELWGGHGECLATAVLWRIGLYRRIYRCIYLDVLQTCRLITISVSSVELAKYSRFGPHRSRNIFSDRIINLISPFVTMSPIGHMTYFRYSTFRKGCANAIYLVTSMFLCGPVRRSCNVLIKAITGHCLFAILRIVSKICSHFEHSNETERESLSLCLSP